MRQVVADRTTEDAAGVFGQRIAELKPDVVIDLICFNLESAQQLVGSLREKVQHFLHCGTIWVLGHRWRFLPPKKPRESHLAITGSRNPPSRILLTDQARRYGFPATVLQPGHIVGPGWIPINPAGNLDPDVFTRSRGEEVTLPNLGMETLHHVHADDVAQSFVRAIANRSVSIGEAFHVVSARRAYPARLRRKGCWLVRSTGQTEIPGVGGMAQDSR